MERLLETQEFMRREKTILVGAGEEYGRDGGVHDIDPLAELRLLARTAGAEVVGAVIQARSHIDSTYYIGSGKADELKTEVERLDAGSVIFDNDLSPAQVANLQKLLDVKVIDRSGLILDIFALRARTREARTQVELAQMKYLLPRLTRQWTHLSRQVGGIGTRGPGETQLEVDRRAVRNRIATLTRTLKTIEKRRDVSRKGRRGTFRASLVGYTNAGKSSLINTLCSADAPVENMLFKTLDSMTRIMPVDGAPDILVSDTVGFIRNLPHDLVASFKSTLDEVRDADLLLHVIDITNPEWEEQVRVVNDVLSELGVLNTETIMVFNKTDALRDDTVVEGLKGRFPSALYISARNGDGIGDVRDAIHRSVLRGHVVVSRRFKPVGDPLLAQVYRYGRIVGTEAEDDSLNLTFSMPRSMARKLGVIE